MRPAVRLHLAFQLGVVTFLFGEFLQAVHWQQDWLRGHISDLAFPLTIANVSYALPHKHNLRLGLAVGVVAGIGYEIVQLLTNTGDLTDVLCVLVGGAVGLALVTIGPHSGVRRIKLG